MLIIINKKERNVYLNNSRNKNETYINSRNLKKYGNILSIFISFENLDKKFLIPRKSWHIKIQSRGNRKSELNYN